MEGSEHRQRRLGIVLVTACLLLGVLMATMDARKAMHVLRHASWSWAPVALLCSAVSYFCLSAGFSAINRIFGIRLRRRDQIEIGFVSFALNNLVSVGGLAGYSLRLYLLRRRGMAAGDVVSASLVHSYFNHLAMMSLLPIGLTYLLVNHPLGRTRTFEMSLATAAAVGLLVGTTILLLSDAMRTRAARLFGWLGSKLLRRDLEHALHDLDTTLGRGVAAIRRRPSVLGVPLLFVVADWATSVLALGACFEALRTPLHPGVLLTGFAIGVTAGFLSMLPGGLGVQEGSMAGIFVLLGVEYERAVLAAMLFRVLYYVVPFAASLVLYAHILRATPAAEVKPP
ncbi:MAG TPA: flippase-like domain-containing protein [Candidatus Krumholzibacteria bacterium]|nr:flippase-like domain-containing protein [Candidatus Krumholzibacteria bacterium]